MSRFPIGPKPTNRQTGDGGRVEGGAGTSKKGGVAKTGKTEKTGKAQEVDRLDAQSGGERPESSSPLTDAVWRGLTELAQKYYGETEQHGPVDGLKVLLRSAGDSTKVDVDKVISRELRDLKAAQLARDTGLDRESARQLVDSLAVVLAPSNV